MIRSPMLACGERKLETGSVVATLVLALFVPSILGLASLLAYDTGVAWLEAYQPIVYFHPDTSDEAVERLAAEVESWSAVEKVEIRTSADAYEVLDDRMGKDELDALGVTPSMFPSSLLVVPSTPVAGHVDLVAEVSALEARMEVDTVDVPSSVPMRLVSTAHVVGILSLLLGALALFAAGVALYAYLRRLRSAETDMEAVLGIFGAHPADIRRPTLVRGAVLGLWSGMGVTLLLSGTLAIWQSQAPAALGLEAMISPWAWPLVAIPVVVGPALGVMVGFLAAGGGAHRTQPARASIFA